MLISKEQSQNPATSISHEKLVETAEACLAQELYIEAQTLFLQLSEETAGNLAPSTCFNLAICYLQAKKPTKAIEWLDKALNQLKSNKTVGLSRQSTSPIDTELLAFDAESDSYRSPMNAFMAERFVDRSKLRIQRVLVDACVEAEQWQRAEKLISILLHYGYKNIKNASEKIPAQ